MMTKARPTVRVAVAVVVTAAAAGSVIQKVILKRPVVADKTSFLILSQEAQALPGFSFAVAVRASNSWNQWFFTPFAKVQF